MSRLGQICVTTVLLVHCAGEVTNGGVVIGYVGEPAVRGLRRHHRREQPRRTKLRDPPFGVADSR
jgi:hypothetical protein